MTFLPGLHSSPLSHLDSSVCGSCMFSTTVILSSHWDIRGLAAARIDVRAFREQMMPAFAMDRVCCSCRQGRAQVTAI